MATSFAEQNMAHATEISQRISTHADNPTAWQRHPPNFRAKILYLYRFLLAEQDHEDWPHNADPDRDRSSLGEGVSHYWDVRQHVARLIRDAAAMGWDRPPERVNHYHRTVPSVIPANVALVRGDLLTYNQSDPTDLHTGSPNAMHATAQNTLLAGNYDLLATLNDLPEPTGEANYAIGSEKGRLAHLKLVGEHHEIGAVSYTHLTLPTTPYV